MAEENGREGLKEKEKEEKRSGTERKWGAERGFTPISCYIKYFLHFFILRLTCTPPNMVSLAAMIHNGG